VFIPKAGGKQRPLGIPVIADRVLQARVVNALEPEWEARFEPRSYGFRPGRGCQDAIGAIYRTLKGPNPQRTWALDADLAAAFDRIDHGRLLAALGTFPARGLVEQWLKAGVVDRGRLAATEEGTPQGGVISPLLLNIALHGMEQAAGVRYWQADTDGARIARGSPVLIRYADDFVVLCHTREQADAVKAALAQWLTPRGLTFNEDKTQVVSIDDGFDFLGFNVRRYDGTLLIKPAKAAVKRIRERLRVEMRALRGHNAATVLRKINPIVRGWSAYYRTVVSSDTFTRLDDYVWKLTYKWGNTATRTSRGTGSSPDTSAGSTRPGRTGGCSATAPAAPTCSSSPGPRSSGTQWSRARRHPTIPPLPTTGPSDARKDPRPRWAAPPCACYRHRTAAAPCAAGSSCTLTTHQAWIHRSDRWGLS
jgi:RNA-directed DNA polymerase